MTAPISPLQSGYPLQCPICGNDGPRFTREHQLEAHMTTDHPPATELEQLRRARDAAIAHLASGDVTGALAALTMQRDAPNFFDRATFDGEAPR